MIGCGGIGSNLIEYICDKINNQQIDNYIKFEIADNDMVEIAQINYQNFKLKEVGMNKAYALAKRFKKYGIKSWAKRIDREAQLMDYDVIILCVDNDKTRKMVIEYCHKHNTEFLDLRATGRKYFAMPKTNLKENLKFIDSKDNKEYSCQEKEDLKKGLYQMGNEIIAKIGTQMLLNLLRGHDNRIINGVI